MLFIFVRLAAPSFVLLPSLPRERERGEFAPAAIPRPWGLHRTARERASISLHYSVAQSPKRVKYLWSGGGGVVEAAALLRRPNGHASDLRLIMVHSSLRTEHTLSTATMNRKRLSLFLASSCFRGGCRPSTGECESADYYLTCAQRRRPRFRENLFDLALASARGSRTPANNAHSFLVGYGRYCFFAGCHASGTMVGAFCPCQCHRRQQQCVQKPTHFSRLASHDRQLNR
jgi:hypothetical protein